MGCLVLNTDVSESPRDIKPVVQLVGDCDTALWGLAPVERHARAFARAGAGEVLRSGQTPPEGGTVILLRQEYVLAEELVRALVATPGVVLVVEGVSPGAQVPVAAHVAANHAKQMAVRLGRGDLEPDDPIAAELRILGPAELGSSYNQMLRKRADPFVLSLAERPIIEVEKATFSAVYKGATDFVTKWCWPLPARWVTRWAAKHRISPNTVTTVSLVFVFIAIYLFAEGQYLLGVAAAWFMTFLDTVDGKLARVTLTSSKWGNVYDHGIDLIHPPFWWAAWWYGLRGFADPALEPWLTAALWVVIVGYVAGLILFIVPIVWEPTSMLFPVWVFMVSVAIFLHRPDSTPASGGEPEGAVPTR